MATRKTLLIVDDHTLFREGLKTIISRNPAYEVVGETVARLSKGYKSSIEILKSMRDPKKLKSTKRTPYEGVHVSVPPRQ